ncbi:MAG: DUF4255 domain-containing protein, partial [bacterium]|nr:DUF4255 domain-containing protein [bacterium]
IPANAQAPTPRSAGRTVPGRRADKGLILPALELIRDKMNEFFRHAVPRDEPWVILSNLGDHQGQIYDKTRDKVVMFLANIQRETTVSTYHPSVPIADHEYAVVAPPLYVDLFLLFLANFYDKTYHEGLMAISRTINFFQQHPWFTHESLPNLDPDIEKLTFELINLEITDLNYLMGLAGTKYLPSVYYKVRMIPFRSDAIERRVSPVRDVETPE